MKTCKQCQSSFNITDENKAFYVKIDVPEPTFCPQCRAQRRLSWRNERKLYRRKCDATNVDIISNISPDKPFPVFEKNYWFSDKHNPIDYGREFDFSKTFFEQFGELQKATPRFSIQQQEPMENSEFCNCASNCKNSYFIFDSDYCEDSYYSNVLKKSKDCCDCSFTSQSELCYETINCKSCYNLKFSEHCINCSDSIFLRNCTGCSDCAFSFNLRNKKYYIANQEYSKEQYNKKIAEYQLNQYSNLLQYKRFFEEQSMGQPHKFRQGTQNENVSGDYINNSKNVFYSFNIDECWDIAYCNTLFRAKDCCDVSSFGEKIELIYECTAAGINTQNCKFCFTPVINSNDLIYCDTAYSSKDCFGCVGVNHNQYCILNKQYSKKEYEILVAKIIEHMKKNGEWGEFFPITLSPFSYNETVAQEYFPMTKEETLKRGWKWKDVDNIIPKVEKIITKEQMQDLPDAIDKVPDEILNWALTCEVSGRPFMIQKAELKFYRETNLPLPRKHPDVRHEERLKLMNPRKLFQRECDNCHAKIETTYPSKKPLKVLCEECYLKVVY